MPARAVAPSSIERAARPELGNTPFDDAASPDSLPGRPQPGRARRRSPRLSRVVFAFTLLILGLAMLIAGAATGELPILGVGVLAALPGAYGAWRVVRVWRRRASAGPAHELEDEEDDAEDEDDDSGRW